MKKTLLTITATLVSIAAFAQGKVQFANDSLHLVYYATDGSVRPADTALAGQGVSLATMPLGVTLVADLYGGTSSGSLTFQSSTTFGASVGRYASVNVITGNTPAGSPGFFRVDVRDSGYTNAAAALAGGSYGGSSIVFNVTPSSSAYNSIINPNTPSFSTWTAGQFDMSTQSGLPGARGAISVGTSIVPEPSTMAMLGLGAAALVSLRRRK